MKRLLAATMVVVGVLAAGNVFAAKPPPWVTANLIMVASGLTGLELPEGDPGTILGSLVLIVSDDEILAEKNAQAGYFPRHDVVVLKTDWDVGNVQDQATLLHELVHYLQDQNGLDYEHYGGRGGLEKVAYDAMIEYVMGVAHMDREQAMEALGLNEFTYKLVTTNWPPGL